MEEVKSEESNKWEGFIEKTKNESPRSELIKALPFINEKNEALDLGPGAFNETKFLLEKGFKHVVAVDLYTKEGQEIYDQLPKDKVEYVISSFENFNFPEAKFDVVNAQYSLPFNPPDTFNEVFNKIKKSLKKGGIFTGQFFGPKHGWNTKKLDMSFHTEEQVKELLSDMEILDFDPIEEDKKPRMGDEIIHWHVFHVIARKK